MRFLTGTDIHREVVNIMSRTGEVMAAVAYWGSGASELTGIARKKNRKKTRIICDLLSGSCNPAEIEKLMKFGVQVKTLDRLHAKVWCSGNDVILGSANASNNGLPDKDQDTLRANVEAAILTNDPSLSQEMLRWFETQWQTSTAIDEELLDRARTMWNHRNRFSRAFTATFLHQFWNPQQKDRLSGLRLVAYQETDWSKDAERFRKEKAGLHYSDEELAVLNGEAPFYEWPLHYPDWNPGAGTVLMDFTCKSKDGRFTFNGFWSVRNCPPIKLTNSSLTLLTKLPHFNGHSISAYEQAGIADAIKRHVTYHDYLVDDFDFLIGMDFLNFCQSDSTMLKRRLVDQAVETAKDLCRAGQFDSSLTLNTIRRCKEDPTWLRDYARYVGLPIYENGNPRKRVINLELGRRICADIGATILTNNNNRKRLKVKVAGEIIQSYTPIADFCDEKVAIR